MKISNMQFEKEKEELEDELYYLNKDMKRWRLDVCESCDDIWDGLDKNDSDINAKKLYEFHQIECQNCEDDLAEEMELCPGEIENKGIWRGDHSDCIKNMADYFKMSREIIDLRLQISDYKERINADGSKSWYKNGDKFTGFTTSNGDKSWYVNGELHREDGPAIETADGSKCWYVYGKLHRVEDENGYKQNVK